MKRLIIFILIFVLFSSSFYVYADNDFSYERVVIGADLSPEQIDNIYSVFDIRRGSVPELIMTSEEEHSILNGIVESEKLGTKSISCVYLRLLPSGSGIIVSTHNISWCTDSFYRNALSTVGINDIEIIVAAPFEVSGTSALAGIIKAYEDLTESTLDSTAKETGTQELVISGDLADEIGSDAAGTIMDTLKSLFGHTKEMTDKELESKIKDIANEFNISLNDSQTSKLMALCRQFEKIDGQAVTDKVRDIKEFIKKTGEFKDTLNAIREKYELFKEKATPYIDSFKTNAVTFIDYIKRLLT